MHKIAEYWGGICNILYIYIYIYIFVYGMVVYIRIYVSIWYGCIGYVCMPAVCIRVHMFVCFYMCGIPVM